ncbi:hypothetical protein OV090_45280 [Nannocystis sp. RBIL2]|uniref:hypothetical protein n=1 Tax=Nannocystis sp. RBIL2 TaxID=2996788 RepID=UPI00226EA748|nr:hypothetical protein [Nannocystis sp. RBIL2]MCY1072043.1 hypothetical protein [Nannocystis sp. RBIL2]
MLFNAVHVPEPHVRHTVNREVRLGDAIPQVELQLAGDPGFLEAKLGCDSKTAALHSLKLNRQLVRTRLLDLLECIAVRRRRRFTMNSRVALRTSCSSSGPSCLTRGSTRRLENG